MEAESVLVSGAMNLWREGHIEGYTEALEELVVKLVAENRTLAKELVSARERNLAMTTFRQLGCSCGRKPGEAHRFGCNPFPDSIIGGMP